MTSPRYKYGATITFFIARKRENRKFNIYCVYFNGSKIGVFVWITCLSAIGTIILWLFFER